MASSEQVCCTLPVVTVLTRFAAPGHGFLESWKKRLGCIPCMILDHLKPDEALAHLQEAEIILADPEFIGKFFSQLRKAKWVQCTYAGIDGVVQLLKPCDIPPPFTLTRLGLGQRTSIAEHVIGHMIAHERRFYDMRKAQEQKLWEGTNYRTLGRLTLGILGLGNIGEEIARLCKAFGMRVWGLGRRELPPERISKNVDEYRPLSGLTEVLANCDYICNVLPATRATDDLLSGDVLSSCNKQPVFINVGRANVISEDSILNALDEGWISHAILDVFRTEPLPASSPLWSSPKVTISPHCSANTLPCSAEEYSSATVFPGAIIDTMEVNYNRFVRRQPLEYAVDWESGY